MARERSAVLRVRVTFDDTLTDAESIATALDKVLETARIDLLEEYGYPKFGPVEPDAVPPPRGSPDEPELCAVALCRLKGEPMRCPYDGTLHGHGRVHYECHNRPHFAPDSKLRFKTDEWRLICYAHQTQLLVELGDKVSYSGDG